MNATAAPERRDPFTPLEPAEESKFLQKRHHEWNAYYRPKTDYAAWIIGRVVAATVRVDRCFSHESALRAYEARRARASWNDDRRLEAEQFGERLAKSPAKFRRLLEKTRQGADWIIERWQSLESIAQAGHDWTEPQRSLALDLLAAPVELRDGAAPFDPRPGQSAAEAQARFARAERERLAAHRERVLLPRDDQERRLAESGVSWSFSPAMLRIHRQEAYWTREYHSAFNEFRRVCPPPPSAGSTPSSSPPQPAPPPDDSDEIASLDRALLSEMLEESDDAPPSRPSTAAAPAPSGNRRLRRAREARLRGKRTMNS